MRALALVHHHRPDQVGGRQSALAHQAADPVGLAQPAQAQGGVGGERRAGHGARSSRSKRRVAQGWARAGGVSETLPGRAAA